MSILKKGAWASALIASLVMAALAFAGPQQDDQTRAATVEKEFREALQALKKYTAEQREQAVQGLKAAMEDLDAEIDRLNKKFERDWDRMDKTAREEASETLKALRKRSNELAEWYGALKHSSADAWEKVKKGFADSYEILSKNLGEAARELDKGRQSK